MDYGPMVAGTDPSVPLAPTLGAFLRNSDVEKVPRWAEVIGASGFTDESNLYEVIFHPNVIVRIELMQAASAFIEAAKNGA